MHGRVFRIAALPGEQTNDFSSRAPRSQPRNSRKRAATKLFDGSNSARSGGF